MRSSRTLVTNGLAAAVALMIAMQPLAAQGKGKGGGDDQKDRGRGRAGQGQGGQRGQGSARMDRAQPPRNTPAAERGAKGRGIGVVERSGAEVPRSDRAQTRADQRIERPMEREFAGDVDLRGRGRGAGKSRFAREVVVDDLRPSVRRFFAADRAPARAAVGAVARAHMRGVDDDELVITPLGDRVRVLNRAGIVLVDLDDERVRNLGRWDVVPVDDDATEGAPSFCRSGEGHPVFGRQWCIDKRFGLGGDGDFRWGRTDRITDVVFRQPLTTGSLTRDALLALLGPIAFDRLALHAITLGLSDPLGARWMVAEEPGAPRVLLVSAGRRPVAEVVDIDRDDRADMMVVALRDW